MAWSGGTFTRTNGVNTGATTWATDESGGVGIVSSRHDTHDQDLATGINQCINKDGSNTATQLNVDNLRLDGNTVSSTDSNGNINLTPNGTGRTVINSGGATVSGYVSGTHTYIREDGGNSTNFDVSANVTESTFESVGPTGSSATNIWTAMDSITAGARIAIIRCVFYALGDESAVNILGQAFVRMTGNSTAASNANRIVIIQKDNNNLTEVPEEADEVEVRVPLDASRRFDITWSCSSEASVSINLYLVGFIL